MNYRRRHRPSNAFYFNGIDDDLNYLKSDLEILNPTRGGFLKPPLYKNGNFSPFFFPIESKNFDFSYKPIRMPIIAVWVLEMPKKGFL